MEKNGMDVEAGRAKAIIHDEEKDNHHHRHISKPAAQSSSSCRVNRGGRRGCWKKIKKNRKVRWTLWILLGFIITSLLALAARTWYWYNYHRDLGTTAIWIFTGGGGVGVVGVILQGNGDAGNFVINNHPSHPHDDVRPPFPRMPYNNKTDQDEEDNSSVPATFNITWTRSRHLFDVGNIQTTPVPSLEEGASAVGDAHAITITPPSRVPYNNKTDQDDKEGSATSRPGPSGGDDKDGYGNNLITPAPVPSLDVTEETEEEEVSTAQSVGDVRTTTLPPGEDVDVKNKKSLDSETSGTEDGAVGAKNTTTTPTVLPSFIPPTILWDVNKKRRYFIGSNNKGLLKPNKIKPAPPALPRETINIPRSY